MPTSTGTYFTGTKSRSNMDPCAGYTFVLEVHVTRKPAANISLTADFAHRVKFLRDVQSFYREELLVDLFSRMQPEAFTKWLPISSGIFNCVRGTVLMSTICTLRIHVKQNLCACFINRDT